MGEPVGFDNHDGEGVSHDSAAIPRDGEEIPFPAIQSQGWLLTCDEVGGEVLRHSANLSALLPHLQGKFLGRNLREVIGVEAAHDIRNALSRLAGNRPVLLPRFKFSGCERPIDVTVHLHDGETLIEIEPAGKNQNSSSQNAAAQGPLAQGPSALDQARALIDRIADLDDIESLFKTTTRLLAAILQYDRVVICQFAADGQGDIIAESRRRGLDSLLDRRLPAPILDWAGGRALAPKIHAIGDVDDAPVAIVPALIGAGKPLDLSFAHLRSDSAVYRQNLREMGAAAALSLSIIVDGDLWGLIFCGHGAPKFPGMELRATAEMFGEFFSLRLQTILQAKRLASAKTACAVLQELVAAASSSVDPAAVLAANLPAIASLLPCDGAALWIDGRWQVSGSAVEAARGASLAHFVAGLTSGGALWSTTALGEVFAPARDYRADVAAVVAVPLSRKTADLLFFFRKDVRPAQSEGGSHPWTEGDLAIADSIRHAIVEIIFRHSETLDAERGKAEMRQRLLNDELNHRVKNTLALINALISQPQPAQTTLADFVRGLQGRLQALAHAHDQVVRGEGGGSLQALLTAELSPYCAGAAIFLKGPEVLLDARAFSVMALVIHELAANAAKFGALSRPEGRLDVSWSFEPREDCQINWTETGGPPVAPPPRSGFGSKLLERSIQFELGGECVTSYPASGARAFISLPALHLGKSAPSSSSPIQAVALRAPGAAEPQLAPTKNNTDISVMIVEDQMLIAMDLEAALIESGAKVACACASVAAARQALATLKIDAAILDFNLGDETSLPLAKELMRRGVPFIFATGYGDSLMIPAELGEPIIVRKPYDVGQVSGALDAAINRARKNSVDV